ncbi:MAG: chemotaxis protein CheD, partial [Sedimentibacter sp.]
AKMFEMKGNSIIGNIGERNIEATKETLQKLRIKLLAEDTGKNFGRTITFDSNTGNLTIKTFVQNTKVI